MSEQQCCICLGIIRYRGEPQNQCTDHYYCFDCIMKWVDTSSTCPICRATIGEIQKVR